MPIPPLTKKTLTLEGYISAFGIQEKAAYSTQNTCGGAFAVPRKWTFHIRLTQAGALPDGKAGHYALHLTTSSEEQKDQIVSRLVALQSSVSVIRFDAPLSFVNYSARNSSPEERLRVGVTLGFPISALDEGAIVTDPDRQNYRDRLMVHLDGTIVQYGRERRGDRLVYSGPRVRMVKGTTIRQHVLLLAPGCSAQGHLGRFGLVIDAEGMSEVAYVERAIAWLCEHETPLSFDTPVDYFQYRDKETDDFRCGSLLRLPIEVFDAVPV